jgi:DNA repair protein RecO (recombination protein O)
MEWSDEGLVLGVRPHGETAVLLDVLTRAHGRQLGLVHGGRSRKLRPLLQTGNHLDVTWRARLDEHLGHFAVEMKRGYGAGALERPLALLGLQSLSSLGRLLPEREPHASLYEVAMFVLAFLDDDTAWPALYARWELRLLEDMGFGLDLMTCAATGSAEDLAYVSPRSGRAVSRAAGEPYRSRLLRLPPFLKGGSPPSAEDVVDALMLAGHFLERHVLRPRDLAMPETRTRLIAGLKRRASHSSQSATSGTRTPSSSA